MDSLLWKDQLNIAFSTKKSGTRGRDRGDSLLDRTPPDFFVLDGKLLLEFFGTIEFFQGGNGNFSR